jgi:hypothetical protein
MKAANRRLLVVLLVVFMVLSFYGIFNAGSPNSLFRLLVRDPSYDVLITLIISAGVVLSVILLGTGREASPLEHMLRANDEHIRTLRGKGHSDEQIADSFLRELGIRPGIVRRLARRRVLRYLSRLK